MPQTASDAATATDAASNFVDGSIAPRDTGTVPDSGRDAGSRDVDAATPPPRDFELWFTPNIGSRDMLELFTAPDAWSTARTRVQVMKLYSSQIKAVLPEHCPMCGPNLRPALQSAGVFERLDAWGIALATESGVVKPGACLAEGERGTIADARWTLSLVEENGGTLAAIAMDEPYRGGEMEFAGVRCGYSMEQSADQTVAWLEGVRALRPGIALGDIEPYPHFSAPELIAWLDALAARGGTLDFFHLDVDLNALKHQTTATTARDLRTLRDAASARGIPFGVIVIGNEWLMNRSSDQPRSYYETSTAWAREIEAAIGAPDHVLVQSWVDSSGMGEDGSTRILPVNLPEGAPHTHATIIEEVYQDLHTP